MHEVAALSSHVAQLAESVRDSLRGQAEELGGAMRAASGDGAAIRQELAKQAADLRVAAEQVQARLAAVGQAMDSRATTLMEAADNALIKATDLGTVLDRHTNALSGAIDRVGAEAADLGTRLRGEVEILAQATADAQLQAKRLKETQVKAGRDAFLRTATKMVDELNTLAADIHGLLDADVPEDVLQSYRRGDKSVFARRLFRFKDSYMIPALEQRFRRDEKFRQMVTSYMARFEDLLAQASEADPESTLNATFITADIGKLYLVMSRSLGRGAAAAQ
jgi:hypothetical protein